MKLKFTCLLLLLLGSNFVLDYYNINIDCKVLSYYTTFLIKVFIEEFISGSKL